MDRRHYYYKLFYIIWFFEAKDRVRKSETDTDDPKLKH